MLQHDIDAAQSSIQLLVDSFVDLLDMQFATMACRFHFRLLRDNQVRPVVNTGDHRAAYDEQRVGGIVKYGFHRRESGLAKMPLLSLKVSQRKQHTTFADKER